MRLVLRYQQSDGCTYSCTNTHPVEYESAEALLVDLMEAAEAALHAGRDFKMVGETFDPTFFYERLSDDQDGAHGTVVKAVGCRWFAVPPDILTLDEWFASADALKA